MHEDLGFPQHSHNIQLDWIFKYAFPIHAFHFTKHNPTGLFNGSLVSFKLELKKIKQRREISDFPALYQQKHRKLFAIYCLLQDKRLRNTRELYWNWIAKFAKHRNWTRIKL